MVPQHRHGTKTEAITGGHAGRGGGAKRLETGATPKRSGPTAKVCVADWNGDGRADLLVGDDNAFGTNTYRGFVWVYLRK